MLRSSSEIDRLRQLIEEHLDVERLAALSPFGIFQPRAKDPALLAIIRAFLGPVICERLGSM